MSATGKKNGARAAPQPAAATVAMALSAIQGLRHRRAVLAAAADYVENNFLAGDLGPARFRIAGHGGNELPRADSVVEIVAELRHRASEEHDKALAVLSLSLSCGPDQMPSGDAASAPKTDDGVELNPDRGTRRWE